MKSGELYHPLRWSAVEAFQFLTDVPKLEAAGIVVPSLSVHPYEALASDSISRAIVTAVLAIS